MGMAGYTVIDPSLALVEDPGFPYSRQFLAPSSLFGLDRDPVLLMSVKTKYSFAGGPARIEINGNPLPKLIRPHPWLNEPFVVLEQDIFIFSRFFLLLSFPGGGEASNTLTVIPQPGEANGLWVGYVTLLYSRPT
jgi:hypothetical protein